MKLTWFGHSAFRLDFADTAVLIDPFFTGNPGFQGDRAKVVTNFELCMYLASEGLENFDPMNTGGATDQGGFTVTLVRADHSAGLVETGVNYPLGSANGVIVKAPGEPTLYHMGDTDVFGDMALIAELHRPQVVIVPIGDRFTMGPDTAAFAIKRFFPSSTVIPCHYGSFPVLEPTADRFVAAMAGSSAQVVVPHKTVGVRIAARD